jgi:hypothetical protein
LVQWFQPNSPASGFVLLATAGVLVLATLEQRRRAPLVESQFPNPELFRKSSRRLAHWSVAMCLAVLLGGTALAVALGGGWALLIPTVCLLVVLVFVIRASRRLQRIELARAPPARPI